MLKNEDLKTMQFEVQVKDVEYLNPELSKGKAYILYTGVNRNNSYISQKTVDSAISSLFYIPVVGEYKKEKEDMGSHGGRLEITDEGVDWIRTTVPYGCVPSKEDANVKWEVVTFEDGTQKEFLTCDVYLWSGRYPELEKTIKEYSNQSMEISVSDGSWKKVKDDNSDLYSDVYEIKKFNFSALCLLGQDVEPCFENAKVVGYSLDKDEFKTQFNELIAEIKEFQKAIDKADEPINIDISIVGGEDMPNENEVIEPTGLVIDESVITEDTSAQEVESQDTVNVDDSIQDTVATNEESEVVEVIEENHVSEFEIVKVDLLNRIETLEKENSELKEFKLSVERVEKLSLFDSVKDLSEEDVQDLKDNIDTFSKSEIEKELIFRWGKKKLEFEKIQNTKEDKDVMKFALADCADNGNKPVYSDIVEKHKK